MTTKSCFGLLLFVFATNMNAQLNLEDKTNQPARYTVGFSLGAAIGSNDVPKIIPGPALGFHAEKRFRIGLILGAQFNTLRYRGSADELPRSSAPWDSSSYFSNSRSQFKYESRQTDCSLKIGFDISRFFREQPGVSVIISSGFGMTSIHSEADYYDKKPNRWFHETYDGRHVIIPVGLSVQWNCCDKTIVGLDMQGNYLRTDNVDVVNNPDFTNKYFDKYGTLSFSLRYKIL